jgi:ubiquinone/menaquinone biosynthesis C-methylase UbiE
MWPKFSGTVVSMFACNERLSATRWMPPWVRAQHAERFRWAAALTAGNVVADVACGEGLGAREMAAGGAARVDGFDSSSKAIVAASRAMSDRRLAFCVADATRLPVRDGTYDILVSFETIEHIDDDRRFLAEAARVLKPAGRFVCSTPNRRLLDPGTKITNQPFNPFHVREYTQGELEGLLREFFASIAWFGQSQYHEQYVRLLQAIGRAVPSAAVKLHQARKLLCLPLDPTRRHEPAPVLPRYEPEILIAICWRRVLP